MGERISERIGRKLVAHSTFVVVFFLVVEFDGEGGDTFLEVVGLYSVQKELYNNDDISNCMCVCVLRPNNTHYS